MAEFPQTLENANRFVQLYTNLISTPAIFPSADPTEKPPVYYSDEHIVKKRALNIRAALQRRRLHIGPAAKGDITISEWTSSIITDTILKTFQVGDDLDVRLCPTTLDESHYHSDEDEYHRGADFMIQSSVPMPEHMKVFARKEDYATDLYQLHIPLMAIDVTLAPDDVVERKRERYGIQPVTGTPVVVLPLQEYEVVDFTPDYYTHLRTDATECILTTGSYKPFYGVSPDDRVRWSEYYLQKLIEGVQICGYNLENCTDKRIVNSPGHQLALDKLVFMRQRLTNGIQNIYDLKRL